MKTKNYHVRLPVILFLLTFLVGINLSAQVIDRIVDIPDSSLLDSLIIAYKIPDARVEKNSDIKKDSSLIKNYWEIFYEKANYLITNNLLPDNKEFKAYIYSRMGAYFIESKKYEEAKNYLEKAQSEAGMLEPTKSLKYLANIESNLLPILNETGRYNDVISLSKKIIEKYQGVGSGFLKNIIATSAINEFVYAAKKQNWTNDALKLYLEKISNAYNNDVACMADFHLLRIAKEQADISKAKQIKEKILSRYPKTQEFTNIYQSYFDLEEKKQSN